MNITAKEIFERCRMAAMAKTDRGQVAVYINGERFSCSGEVWGAYLAICEDAGLMASAFRPGVCVAGPYVLDYPADKRDCGKYLADLKADGVPFRLVVGKIKQGEGRRDLVATWVWRTDDKVSDIGQKVRMREREAVKTLVRLRSDEGLKPERRVARAAVRLRRRRLGGLGDSETRGLGENTLKREQRTGRVRK